MAFRDGRESNIVAVFNDRSTSTVKIDSHVPAIMHSYLP